MKRILLLTSIMGIASQLYAQSGNEIIIDDLTASGNCDLTFGNMIEPLNTVKQTECVRSGAIGGSADLYVTKQQQGAASIGSYYTVVSGVTYKSFELAAGNGGIFPFSLTYDGVDGNTNPNNPTLTGPVLGDFTNKNLRVVASIEVAASVTLTGKIWDGSGNLSTTQIVLNFAPSSTSQNYDFPTWAGTANLTDIRAFQLSYTTTQGSHDLSIDKISAIDLTPLPVTLVNFSGIMNGHQIALN